MARSTNMSDNSDSFPAGAGPDSTQEWEQLIQSQTSLFKRLTDANAELTKQVEELKSELSLHRAGWVTLNAEKRALAAEVSRLGKSTNIPQNDKSHTVCLIDGDGAVFDERLIIKGEEGGREAANILTQTLVGHNDHCIAIIFLNVKGLADTLVKHSMCSALDLEQFILGFNRAVPSFMIVDSNWGKEASAAKMRSNLLFYCQLPQTKRVIFGGAHDDDHLPALKALQTEGVLDKLVILKATPPVARQTYKFIKETNLNVVEITGLFSHRDFSSPVRFRETNSQPSTKPRRSKLNLLPRALAPEAEEATDSDADSASSMLPQPRSVVFSPSVPPSSRTGRRNLGVLSNFVQHNAFSNDDNSPAGSVPSAMQVHDGLQPQVDSSKQLTRQNPPLCNFYYLHPGRCINGDACRFSHQYNLSPQQIEEYRTEVKGLPCPKMKHSGTCTYGNNCLMGHVCPAGIHCWLFATNKCRFSREGMHPASES